MPAEDAPKPRLCGICKKPCTEPKFLPCLHAFCKVCLKFNISKVPTNRQWEGFSCPYCGTYTKAIDPDQPLLLWADQFPDTLVLKKRRSRVSVTSEDAPAKEVVTGKAVTSKETTQTPTNVHQSFSSVSSSVSDEPSSPLTSTSESVSSPTSQGPSSLLTSTSPGPPSPRLFDADLKAQDVTDSANAEEENSSDTVDFNTSEISATQLATQNEDSRDSDQRMCLIHPWKPLIILCSACDSEACGQCLTETHASCKAEAFSSIQDTLLIPDIAEIQAEVQKVNVSSESVKQSGSRLKQTKEDLKTKIRALAQQMIDDIKKEEEKMLNKVRKLYRQEICRLQRGIEPCEGLLKNVKVLKDDVEQLNTHHSTVVLEKCDGIEEQQKALLQKLQAINLDCVPPDIDFVKDTEILSVSLGDLVIDSGNYPKYEIFVDSKAEKLEATATVKEAEETEVASSVSSEQSVTQSVTKSKSQTLIARLLSHTPKAAPKQDKTKSKFFVKTPKH